MEAWLFSWKKGGKLQTDIANMHMDLLAFLGNITVRQFCVNSAKMLNGFAAWT